MDSLKSLMDKKQYELVIKLTENSEDSTYLFYRISAFLALGQPLESLKVILEKRSILEKDLSILIKVHIEILCILSKFDDAYKEMEYYKNLPYVSQQVEELLASLPNYIREEERKAYSGKEMSDEQVKKLLRSPEMNDAIIGLDIVREREISKFLEDLKWLMVNHHLQSIRSFSLFVLVQKGFSGTFKFKHIDKIIDVTPTELTPPFVGEPFNSLVKRLSVELKDPALSENAIQILSTHIMYIYPDQIPYTNDEIIEALYQISSTYLHSKKEELKDRCFNKGLDIDKVQELIDDINISLENF